MAPPSDDRDPVEEASIVRSVIGSESGFQLRTPQNEMEEEEDDDYDDAGESTALLGGGGAGARRRLGDGRLGGDGAEDVDRDGDDDDDGDDAQLSTPGWDGYQGFEHIPMWRRPSVYWLLPPYVLFTLAFGGSIVPKLNLIIGLVCDRYFADRSAADPDFVFAPVIPGEDNEQCQIAEVQRIVTTFMMALNFIVGVLSALTVPKIGSLSDRYGRKWFMTLASGGGIIGEVIIILAAKYPAQIHYWWLILASVFDGLAGSFTAGSVMSHSYTSDCTPPSKRGVAIGYLHSCLYLGLAFGPLLAGYLVKWTHELVSVFYVTLACHVFFVLFIVVALPESVSKKRQLLARDKHAADKEQREAETDQLLGRHLQAAEGGGAIPLHRRVYAAVRAWNPLGPLKTLYPRGRHNVLVRRNLVILAAIDTVILGAAMSMGQVTLLYSEFVFKWHNFETSAFMSAVSLVRVLVLLGIFPVLNYVFRIRPARKRRQRDDAAAAAAGGGIMAAATAPSEKSTGADELDVWALRAALLSDVAGIAGYIFVRTGALFAASGIVTALGALGSATIQNSLSKHVPAERVGQLLGAIGLLHALARVSMPLLVNGMYAATVGSYPQAVFVLLLAIFTFVFCLAFFVRPHVYMKEDEPEETPRPSIQRSWNSEDALTDEEIFPVR